MVRNVALIDQLNREFEDAYGQLLFINTAYKRALKWLYAAGFLIALPLLVVELFQLLPTEHIMTLTFLLAPFMLAALINFFVRAIQGIRASNDARRIWTKLTSLERDD